MLCAVLCGVIALLACAYFAGYRLNLSGSMPHTLYRVRRVAHGEALARGQGVVLDLSRSANPVIAEAIARGYVRAGYPMLKRIGAVSGDFVALRNDNLYVNWEPTPMRVASEDAEGRALAAYPTPILVSPDHFWLVSDPDRGFDSRYFGPVPREMITHRATPVFGGKKQ